MSFPDTPTASTSAPTPPGLSPSATADNLAGPAALPAEPWWKSLLGDNAYFQAGFGLMGMGVALTMARQGMVLANATLQRRMLVSLEIRNSDPAYRWFLHWHAAHQRANAAALWARPHQLALETALERRRDGSAAAAFSMVAGPGTHYVRFRGAFMQVKRELNTRAVNVVDGGGRPWETVTITTLSRDRALLGALLEEARDYAVRENEGKLVVYTAWNVDWQPHGQPRRKRPLRSVVLADGVAETIERDIRTFLERRQWYADRGIPYRRGVLLHGPPGSGKTSFIEALAGALGYDICLLNISSRGLGDDKLAHLLVHAPERCIVLIEDIDAAFNKRAQTSEDGYQSAVTFSGFLNALDGVASGEERLVFMTTNHVERLDPALIRPGRVDLSVRVDDAAPEQARRLFMQFFEGGVEQDVLAALGDELSALVAEASARGTRVSMAALQGIFIRNGPAEALDAARELVPDSTRT